MRYAAPARSRNFITRSFSPPRSHTRRPTAGRGRGLLTFDERIKLMSRRATARPHADDLRPASMLEAGGETRSPRRSTRRPSGSRVRHRRRHLGLLRPPSGSPTPSDTSAQGPRRASPFMCSTVTSSNSTSTTRCSCSKTRDGGADTRAADVIAGGYRERMRAHVEDLRRMRQRITSIMS